MLLSTKQLGIIAVSACVLLSACQSQPKSVSTNWLTTVNINNRPTQANLTFVQTGNSVVAKVTEGNNTSYWVQIVGEMNGNVMTGKYMDHRSDHGRCNKLLTFDKAATGYYWGSVRLVFDGNKFTGKRSNCEGALDTIWSGVLAK